MPYVLHGSNAISHVSTCVSTMLHQEPMYNGVSRTCRRLVQIEAETKRTLSIPHHALGPEAKDAIMRQKYLATMKPVSYQFLESNTYIYISTSLLPLSLSLQLLWVLEHLAAVTAQPPETQNERAFQNEHGDTIRMAIQKLQNSGNYKNPQMVWEPFKQVQKSRRTDIIKPYHGISNNCTIT